VKYAWVTEHLAIYPVITMCKMLDISDSGYYDWRGREPSPRALRHEILKVAVKQVHAEQDGIPGSRKIAAELRERPELPSACRHTVQAVMTKMGLTGIMPKRFVPTTTQSDPSKVPAPNILAQDFVATRPNERWVTDITYLWTAQDGWVYVAAMLDLFSRKIVGWDIGRTMETSLVEGCLRNAVEWRRPGQGLLHHSDRGSQYTSDNYRKMLKTLNMECSMSRTGCCYDNAACERFWWSLKHEWTNRRNYATLEDARFSVWQYIEVYYNQMRRHEMLGYHTPNSFEAAYAAGLLNAKFLAA
jgi:putative transposase